MPGLISPVTQQGPAWYRGDCHVHTIHSDGELTPEQVTAEARAAGLNFIATTDHNTTAAHGEWDQHAGADLLVILGVGVTTLSGHWLALGVERGQMVDWQYGAHNDAIYACLEGVHDSGGLCVAAHPYAPYATGTFEYPLQGIDAVEVWNGLWQSDRSWNADNEAAFSDWGHTLADDVTTGSWRPAMGSSDTHLAGQLGTPQTVVMAEDLTASSILSGLRAGRSWIAESAGVDLSFNAVAGGTTAGIGEYMQTPGQPVVLQASVRGVPAGLITLHNHQGVLRRAALSPDRPTEVEWRTAAQESAFVRLEVRHPDGQMAALTNPIILS